MKDSRNDSLLYRFFSRETSEDEDEQVFEWVSSSERNKQEFRKAHDLYYLTDRNEKHYRLNVDRSWGKLSNQLSQHNIAPKTIHLESIRRIAMVVLFILAVGFGSLWSYEHFSAPDNTRVKLVVPSGEKSKMFLADGSLVWLNSETKLYYDPRKPRELFLEGEAYFEVKKDRKHPFLVKTRSGINIRVTGTRFNLRSFSDEAYVETTLEEGEVYITSQKLNDVVHLSPGEQAVYSTTRNELKVKDVSPEVYSVWRNDEMCFVDATLRDIIPQIERWYGVDVVSSKNMVYDARITMSVKTESLRELLEMLKLTSNFEYEIDGSKVKIFAN